MSNKFKNDSIMQRKNFDITSIWFDYFELETIENSLYLYFSNKFSKEVIANLKFIEQIKLGVYSGPSLKISTNSSKEEIELEKNRKIIELEKINNEKYNDTLLKVYSLFILNFSIEWERNIKKILKLCGLLSDRKGIEYFEIENIIKEKFQLLFNSQIYKDIKKIRNIANKIKHDKENSNFIINNIENLLNIQVNIIENNEGSVRNLPKQKGIDEIDIPHFNELIKNLDQRKKIIKNEKKIDISFILKNLKNNINKEWIWEEFSFNMQEYFTLYVDGWTKTFIIFSEEEKNKIEKEHSNI